MDAWKYEIISRVEQDILVNTRNRFHISEHPCIILYLILNRNNWHTLLQPPSHIYHVSK